MIKFASLLLEFTADSDILDEADADKEVFKGYVDEAGIATGDIFFTNYFVTYFFCQIA